MIRIHIYVSCISLTIRDTLNISHACQLDALKSHDTLVVLHFENARGSYMRYNSKRKLSNLRKRNQLIV